MDYSKTEGSINTDQRKHKGTRKYKKYKKTFLTDACITNNVLVVELLLIDTHLSSAWVNGTDDVISMTVVSDSILVVPPVHLKEHSGKVVRFVCVVPEGAIEAIFINTIDASVELEIPLSIKPSDYIKESL